MFLAVFALIVGTSYGQATAQKAETGVASFDNMNFDFGKIKQGVPVTHEFKFTNTGKAPIVITNAQPSCGCTIPDWSKDPIPPGGKGYVKATYNAAAPGAFDKSITVMANVENGVVMLRFHGEVVANTPNN